MNHAKVKVKEEDVLKLILEFLSSRNFHVSMRTLEKETGIVNNSYSDDILFLRELILDGDWEEVLLFAQPFENLEGFNSKQFKYLILKQKFIELLSMKSHVVSKHSTNTIEAVMQTLNQLEEICPSKEEYSNLCWLLTVPNLIERNEFKEWTLDNSRLNCFTLALEIIRNVLPFEKNSKKNMSCASKGRLVQLMVKGLLYETCVELCQMKATGNDDEIYKDISIRANVLQGLGDEYSANLLSWLRSLSSNVFNQPFEQLSLEVILDQVKKYANNPRRSLELTKTIDKHSKNHPLAKSLDTFDGKTLSNKSIIPKYTQGSQTLTKINKNDLSIRDADHTVNENRVKMVPDKVIEDFLPNLRTNQSLCDVNDALENVTDVTISKMSKTDDISQVNGKTVKKSINTLELSDDFAPATQKMDCLSSQDDMHSEKEKQRALVLQKLKEYENRKQQMHDIISNNLNNSDHNNVSKQQNGDSLKQETEKHSSSLDKFKFDMLTPTETVNTVTFAEGAGKINTSTPKPTKKNETETPPPEESPVGQVSVASDLRRFATNKITKNTIASKKSSKTEDYKNAMGKENETKEVENARKGPMINGVRRTLASSQQVIQLSEEISLKTNEKQNSHISKKRLQFEDEPDGSYCATDVEIPKTKTKNDVNIPVAKGPGPKIKTRDGNKVYVTDLLKSREEIKNANASKQNQEFTTKEDKIEITKNISENESNEVNEARISFSPVCMLEDSQAIRAVCFHPDGNIFAVGANSKTLRICKADGFDCHNSNSNEPIPEPSIVFKKNRYHKGSIYCMSWNPLGDIIATGSNDKSIKLMRFDPDQYIQNGVENDLSIHNGTIRELAFMPDKPSLLVSGGAGEGAIKITDCSTCQTIGSLRGHSGNVMSVYAGDGDIIASGCTDNTLRLWDLRSLRCIDVILVGDSNPASVTLNKDGSYLASGQEDGCILLYDISAGRTLQSFRLHQEDCRSVRFSPDSRCLLTGSYDSDISLLHTVGNLELTVPRHYKVANHQDKVIQCRWHPKKYAFLSSSADRTVCLWTSDVNKNQHFL